MKDYLNGFFLGASITWLAIAVLLHIFDGESAFFWLGASAVSALLVIATRKDSK